MFVCVCVCVCVYVAIFSFQVFVLLFFLFAESRCCFSYRILLFFLLQNLDVLFATEFCFAFCCGFFGNVTMGGRGQEDQSRFVEVEKTRAIKKLTLLRLTTHMGSDLLSISLFARPLRTVFALRLSKKTIKFGHEKIISTRIRWNQTAHVGDFKCVGREQQLKACPSGSSFRAGSQTKDLQSLVFFSNQCGVNACNTHENKDELEESHPPVKLCISQQDFLEKKKQTCTQ
jgi:hypothetical protein